MATDFEIAFSTLSDRDLTALATRGQERRVPAGKILYSAGDTTVGFFVVLDGEDRERWTRTGKESPPGRQGRPGANSPGR